VPRRVSVSGRVSVSVSVSVSGSASVSVSASASVSVSAGVSVSASVSASVGVSVDGHEVVPPRRPHASAYFFWPLNWSSFLLNRTLKVVSEP